jgi:hypothetical protein
MSRHQSTNGCLRACRKFRHGRRTALFRELALYSGASTGDLIIPCALESHQFASIEAKLNGFQDGRFLHFWLHQRRLFVSRCLLFPSICLRTCGFQPNLALAHGGGANYGVRSIDESIASHMHVQYQAGDDGLVGLLIWIPAWYTCIN